jgi:diacylglycerol kinase (ATP)
VNGKPYPGAGSEPQSVDCGRVAIIFNPASGTVSAETRRARLERLAAAAGLTCELGETDPERGAGPRARQAVADGMERVLVSGGDGTVAEAADALAGTGVALGVLPGGTGNLLALNFGIPVGTEAAMRLALAGEPRPVDVGRANGRAFLVMAGIGVDALVIQAADRRLKRRLGVLAYLMAAGRYLGRNSVRYRITIDGRRIRRRAQTVMIANVGRITAGLELVPGADPADGLLEVMIVRARSLTETVWAAIRSLLTRRRSDSLIEIYPARQVLIETARPQPVQLDGNEAGTTNRLEARVEPGALRLIFPPAAAARPHPDSSSPGRPPTAAER